MAGARSPARFSNVRKNRAVAKCHHPIGVGGDVCIVGHHQNGDPMLAVEPADDLHDLGGVLRVQISSGLVGQQDRRLVN